MAHLLATPEPLKSYLDGGEVVHSFTDVRAIGRMLEQIGKSMLQTRARQDPRFVLIDADERHRTTPAQIRRLFVPEHKRHVGN